MSAVALGTGIASTLDAERYNDVSVISNDFADSLMRDDFFRKAVFSFLLHKIATTVLLSCVVLVALFLVLSCAVGIVILKRQGVSRDAIVGLVRFLEISVIVLVAFTMRLSLDVLALTLWYVPEWYEYAIVHLMCMSASNVAFLCFVWFAVQRQRNRRVIDNSEDKSTELLVSEGNRKIPASYEI